MEIRDKVMCCGCEACKNICTLECINMIEDEEGFLYPKTNKEKCIQCGVCEKVCPILSYYVPEENRNQLAAIVQHSQREVLKQSTAGGAFTVIAEYVIDRGGVVFGVEMNSDYIVHHVEVDTKADLIKFRNSKYVQSKLDDCYRKVKHYLREGRLVCFSGTPCQIEGLRHYLRKDYNNLILVDVVCRAVPSPGVWKKYIAMENERHGVIESVRFRDKTFGYQYSTMELKSIDGDIYRGGIESQPWLRMFFSGMIIRPSCTECRFRSRYRNSDFTIWDCFNVNSIEKEFDADVGTTRILIHSDKGKKIFDEIKSQTIYKEIDADKAVLNVKELMISPGFHKRHDEFFRDYNIMSMQELLNKYFPNTLTVKIKRNGRLFLNRLGIDKTLKQILRRIK